MYPSHTDAGALQQFQEDVIAEIKNLLRHPEAVRELGVFGRYQAPITAPDRRERERLERIGRQERQLRGERTRERISREQTRPWLEQDRWGLRKRVWQERRDRDRAVLELREQALLEWEQQVAEQLRCHTSWLQELAELEPKAQLWCAEQARRIAEGEATPELWAELWERRKAASCRRAAELRADPAVHAVLHGLPLDGGIYALARAITTRLVTGNSAELPAIPRIPILVAALALALHAAGVTHNDITHEDI